MRFISKKVRHIVFITCAVLLLLYAVLKHNILWSEFYKDNNFLDTKTNNEIEILLLDAIKYQHSAVFCPDKNKIFSDEYISNYLYDTYSSGEKSAFVIINYDFMDSVEQISENQYTAQIQLKWPDDWLYYFTIKRIDNNFVISYFEIDP